MSFLLTRATHFLGESWCLSLVTTDSAACEISRHSEETKASYFDWITSLHDFTSTFYSIHNDSLQMFEAYLLFFILLTYVFLIYTAMYMSTSVECRKLHSTQDSSSNVWCKAREKAEEDPPDEDLQCQAMVAVHEESSAENYHELPTCTFTNYISNISFNILLTIWIIKT